MKRDKKRRFQFYEKNWLSKTGRKKKDLRGAFTESSGWKMIDCKNKAGLFAMCGDKKAAGLRNVFNDDIKLYQIKLCRVFVAVLLRLNYCYSAFTLV